MKLQQYDILNADSTEIPAVLVLSENGIVCLSEDVEKLGKNYESQIKTNLNLVNRLEDVEKLEQSEKALQKDKIYLMEEWNKCRKINAEMLEVMYEIKKHYAIYSPQSKAYKKMLKIIEKAEAMK